MYKKQIFTVKLCFLCYSVCIFFTMLLGKVLVHCLMGISRSATFVAAYLMMKKNMSTKDALFTLRKQREVRPNTGFLVQLLQLEEKGFDKK